MTGEPTDSESTATLDGETGADGATDPDSGSPAGGHGTRGSQSDESAVDEAAESFVDLERDLQAIRGDGDRLRGRAVGVDRIPAADVPAGYPVSPDTSEALELLVRPEGPAAEPQPLYFEWPPGEDGPLATLLALRDVDPSAFADLHGESVPLAVEDGWLVPDLPSTTPRGSRLGLYGVGLSLVVMLLSVVSGTLFGPNAFAAAWAAVTLLVLPVSTYYDAWYLRTHTDWEGGPLFWTTFAFLPYLNAITAAAYLIRRRSADPL